MVMTCILKGGGVKSQPATTIPTKYIRNTTIDGGGVHVRDPLDLEDPGDPHFQCKWQITTSST
jgi:hypothetical protein